MIHTVNNILLMIILAAIATIAISVASVVVRVVFLRANKKED